jgi:RNA polymerase sigma-70 factor (ECF subfamily)
MSSETAIAPVGVVAEGDAALMASFLQKDLSAARALYARYAPRIYGLGIVMFRNKTDAEDLVQDTFLRIWRKGSAFDSERGSLDAWVMLTARSIAIDLMRRRSNEARKLSSERLSEVSSEPGPEQLAELSDLVGHARKAIDRLPPGQRAAVELAYLGERSSTQVARMQGIPVGTAKSRVRLGMATLRRNLVNDDDAA